ncbi:CBY1-interacting BAR domain-containing protein 1-like [Daphnia carinata]|uniref:CBY1-interacting BAR domain-containing protein 1-like n=1 Tax=Daphnia carinata TaxID=120202 RepID=UPI00257B3890|nr:CBY1-interacting BAR domain-containing protein 1-like [Daphnia carinata]
MFRSPSSNSLPHSSATQTRFLQNRIQMIEKHFGEICTTLAVYTRKIAGLRDKGDCLAQTLNEYVAAENVNKNCSQGIKDFAENISFISDHRDTCVNRMEETIIQEISEYAGICKSAMDDIRNCSVAYEKEINHLKYVHKLRQQNPLGRMQISKAESDLAQATTKSVRLGKSIEERIDKLERKKLKDLIGWMKKLALIEMSLHSSSLSILTKAYQQLENVDIESDLEEFRNTLRLNLPLPESSPTRTQSVPSIALPKTPTDIPSKVKRSKSFSDYRQRAESLDSLKVEEYEELKQTDRSDDDEESDKEPSPSRMSHVRRK